MSSNNEQHPVTLGVIPVMLNNEVTFFRFMHDIDISIIFVPLEPIVNVSEVPVPPCAGVPALAWNVNTHKLFRCYVVHDDNSYHFEDWPNEWAWTGIPQETETCLRIVHILKLSPRGPVVAEA